MTMIDSGDWPTPLTEELRHECAKVAQYNAQSLNQEDQLDQKALYAKLFKEPIEYDKEAFALGLMGPTFLIEGKLPLCLKYIQDAAKKEVNPREGIWRLWDPPKDVQRAKVIYDLSLLQKKNPSGEEARLQHNINNSLEERLSVDSDPLDLSLDSHIKKNKGQDKNKGAEPKDGERNPLDESLDDQKKKEKAWREKERAKHKTSTENKGATGSGKAGSSTDAPEKERVRTPPYKRKAGEPDSPASIERLAKSHWRTFASRMKKKVDTDYPRRFRNIRGVEHFELGEFIHGLTFQVEEYSPILQV